MSSAVEEGAADQSSEAGELEEDSRITGETDYLPYVAIIASLITFGSMFLATFISPYFAWRENALSNLGVMAGEGAAGTELTVILFNGGLITGGIIGVVFCAVLFNRVRRREDRVLAATLGLTLALMGLVGIFRQGHQLHFPVAVAFYLLTAVVMGMEGAFRYRVGQTRWALVSGTGAIAAVLTWVLWFSFASQPSEALAIPEIIGALIFAAWLITFAIRVSR